MKIRMQLLSDTIFGNGASIPGEEDISVLRDERGFPYYKGGTLKGIFREELIQYLLWNDKSEEELQAVQKQLLLIQQFLLILFQRQQAYLVHTSLKLLLRTEQILQAPVSITSPL